MSKESPNLDKNQQKRGWTYLYKRARLWKNEQSQFEKLSPITWRCQLSMLNIGEWKIVPLLDAWSIRKEAFAMRHCVDIYLEGCINGRIRIFSVRDKNNKSVATMGFNLEKGHWNFMGIKRFANAKPSDSLLKLERLYFSYKKYFNGKGIK